MTTLKSRMKTSLRRATRVLEAVELGSLNPEEQEEITVEAYENCREQGYAAYVRLWSFAGPGGMADVKVVWAECRGSDEMVAYVGKTNDFGTGNVPSEEVYQTATYFSSKQGSEFSEAVSEKRCAAFIQKLLIPAAKAARKAMNDVLAKKEKAKKEKEVA